MHPWSRQQVGQGRTTVWIEVLRVPCLLAGLAVANAGAGELYRWADADGVVHYSDSKPADVNAETRRFADAERPNTVDVAPAPTLYQPPALPVQPEIVMYGRPTCGYCVKAERYFNARGLAFRNIDISRSPSAHAEFKRLGGQGTPLIFVDGTPVRGFNQAKLDRLLATD